jgi:hypothetical protein
VEDRANVFGVGGGAGIATPSAEPEAAQVDAAEFTQILDRLLGFPAKCLAHPSLARLRPHLASRHSAYVVGGGGSAVFERHEVCALPTHVVR